MEEGAAQNEKHGQMQVNGINTSFIGATFIHGHGMGNSIRTVIAFSNTAGGTLVIGVEDESHYVIGVSNPHDMEEQLANLISDNIVPNLIPEIDIIPFRETYLLVIKVFSSSSRPHDYKKYGLEHGVCR